MAKRFSTTKPDPEMGTIIGQDSKYDIAFTERTQFFIWPTENSDAGYSVDVDSFQGRLWFKDKKDWKKIIIEDLKKELGLS